MFVKTHSRVTILVTLTRIISPDVYESPATDDKMRTGEEDKEEEGNEKKKNEEKKNEKKKESDRQTDRQTDRQIYTKLSLFGKFEYAYSDRNLGRVTPKSVFERMRTV